MKKLIRVAMILCFVLVSSREVAGLEIDEKLTSRFLKISNSKKTVLINRGLEDGLTIGDHAKFFLTTGVIARGVVVQASPTRTIWSIYRIVDSQKMYKDLAVNLKISKPVQMTEDPSKSLHLSPQTTVQVMRGDQERTSLSDEDQRDLSTMENPGRMNMNAQKSFIDQTKSWEAFGMLNFNSMSSSVNEADGQTFTSDGMQMDFSVGVEKYFFSPKTFLGNISLYGLVHSGSSSETSIQGQKVSSSFLEYGGGASYHFLSDPFSIGRLIPFASASFGIGTVQDETGFVGNNTAGLTSNPIDGSSTFFSFGAGAKYYLRNGFGMRTYVDLYTRSETYSFDDLSGGTSEVTRVARGPRIQIGLSYRW